MDYQVTCLEAVESTNSTLKDQARAGAPDKSVIIAARQTAGRGRRGNVWVSPAGNLYMSVLLRRDIPARDAGQMSFVTAVALYDALRGLLPASAVLTQKWPNDLLLEGRKLAGILLESESDGDRLQWLVIGIGVNVQNAPDDAISLSDRGAHIPSPEDIGRRFLTQLDGWLARYEAEGFIPVREAWLSHARGLKETVTVRLPHQTLSGVFTDMDAEGCLILTTDAGRQKIASGEVFFG